MGCRLQSWLEPSIRLQQTTDVGVGPQGGGRLVSAERRVEVAALVAGSIVFKYIAKPRAAPRRCAQWSGCTPFGSCARHDQISRQRRRAGGVVISKELREQMAWPLEFETQRPTQPEVVVYMAGQIAHESAPPGHGRAIRRNPSRSTRA